MEKKKILQVEEVIENLKSEEEEVSLDWIGKQFLEKNIQIIEKKIQLRVLKKINFKLRKKYEVLEKHYSGLKITAEKREQTKFIQGVSLGVAFSLAGLFFFYLSNL